MIKIPDTLFLKNQEPKTFLQFAAFQLQGTKLQQEDYFLNYNDECFIVADGVGSRPHSDMAARDASETALWAYKLVRQRPYYWSEKKAFVARIFRTTNMAILKKQQEPGFAGMASTLDVVLVSDRTYWFGHVGDGALFLYRNGVLIKLTTDHTGKVGALTKFIGQKRFGLRPQISSGRFMPGDILLLVTDGVTKALAGEAIEAELRQSTYGSGPLNDLIVSLLQKAAQADNSDNLTACIVRRI